MIVKARSGAVILPVRIAESGTIPRIVCCSLDIIAPVTGASTNVNEPVHVCSMENHNTENSALVAETDIAKLPFCPE
jgi:hypothetical protein